VTRQSEATHHERQRAHRLKLEFEVPERVLSDLAAAGVDAKKFKALAEIQFGKGPRSIVMYLYQTPESFDNDGPIAMGTQIEAAYRCVEERVTQWMESDYRLVPGGPSLPFEGTGTRGRRIPGRQWTFVDPPSGV
jgi:hypothetical protein